MTGRRVGSTSRSSARGASGPRAKKRFGQHFLTDTNILRRIVDAAELRPGETVIEVGPGRGALTAALAERGARVVAVEVDRDLIAGLRERFAGRAEITIVEGDILEVDVRTLIGTRAAYAVVANLPYNIAAAVIRRFLEAATPPRALVVMVQREVADVIVARPGEMSLLSLAVQVYGRARIVMRVPPGAFSPPPKVESAVVRIDVEPVRHLRSRPTDLFAVARAGFAQPRKQLRNSLAAGLALAPEGAERLLRAADIDPARRPQTLSVGDWDRLAAAWRARSAA